MEGNVENLGKITFKVKLAGVYHDLVLEWSEESKSYEAKQLFKQLESISGIPSKNTSLLRMFGPHPAQWPTYVLNSDDFVVFDDSGEYTVCNLLAREVMRYKNERDFDCFYLDFLMSRGFNNCFVISYQLITELAVHETECVGFCHTMYSKVILDKLRFIITNNEFNSQIKNLLADYTSGTNGEIGAYYSMMMERKVFRHFNIYQYMKMSCRRIVPGRHGNVYLRTHG